MKVEVHIKPEYTEPEVHVKYRVHDRFIDRLVERITSTSLVVIGDGADGKASIPVEDVFYFETVDKKTFIYLEKEVLESRKRLFELEEYLESSPFTRISKSCLLNTERVVMVAPYYGGRFEATLENSEKVIVSKKYTRTFKDKFFEGNA